MPPDRKLDPHKARLVARRNLLIGGAIGLVPLYLFCEMMKGTLISFLAALAYICGWSYLWDDADDR